MASVRDISDGICGYLQGGFGNQLFILAAAWEQADRLGCPLYIDASRFIAGDPIERARETPRDFELGEISFPGIVLRKDSPWFRNSPRRPAVARRPGRGASRLKVYRQPSLKYHEDVNRVTPGTTLLGYFQSWRYFGGIADRLATALTDAAISESEAAHLATLGEAQQMTAHVRRGDYLTPEARLHHGIASASYFERAIALLRHLHGAATPVRVFSDSPEIVRLELAELENLEFVDDTSALGSVGTVLAMSRGTGFAMSNSSFSWWAAWLLNRRDPSATIIAPRPWQADGQSGHDQLLPTWLTLDAR
ncbi:alpha-1,2-fucosyltransferase [Agromyces soli]